ncbi:MAG: hypothetical protein ACR2HQ_12690 [Ilumatobacteraceae bacterium]
MRLAASFPRQPLVLDEVSGLRWTSTLGGIRLDDELTVARTIRTRLVAIPGRLVNRGGRPTLRLPTRWPWRTAVTDALQQLRGLTFAPG